MCILFHVFLTWSILGSSLVSVEECASTSLIFPQDILETLPTCQYRQEVHYLGLFLIVILYTAILYSIIFLDVYMHTLKKVTNILVLDGMKIPETQW